MENGTGNENNREPSEDEGEIEINFDFLAEDTTGDEEIAMARALEERLAGLDLEAMTLEAKVEILKTATLAKEEENARDEEELNQEEALLQSKSDEYNARHENLDMEKKMCLYLFKQRHDVQKKMAEMRAKLEAKKEKWRLDVEKITQKCDEYEQKYLQMPWAAEYKKLYDEDKRLNGEIEDQNNLVKELADSIAELEEELAKTEPADVAWNKVCVQFASDMIHTRRMNLEAEELQKKIDAINMRKRREQKETGKKVFIQERPTTPEASRMPPKTPRTVQINRNQTPAAAVASASRKSALHSPMMNPRMDTLEQQPPTTSRKPTVSPRLYSPMMNPRNMDMSEQQPPTPRRSAMAPALHSPMKNPRMDMAEQHRMEMAEQRRMEMLEQHQMDMSDQHRQNPFGIFLDDDDDASQVGSSEANGASGGMHLNFNLDFGGDSDNGNEEEGDEEFNFSFF